MTIPLKYHTSLYKEDKLPVHPHFLQEKLPSEFSKNYIKNKLYAGKHKIKLLPEDFKISTDILTAGNKTALISFKTLSGTIIENEEITETHRNFLKFFWKK